MSDKEMEHLEVSLNERAEVVNKRLLFFNLASLVGQISFLVSLEVTDLIKERELSWKIAFYVMIVVQTAALILLYSKKKIKKTLFFCLSSIFFYQVPFLLDHLLTVFFLDTTRLECSVILIQFIGSQLFYTVQKPTIKVACLVEIASLVIMSAVAAIVGASWLVHLEIGVYFLAVTVWYIISSKIRNKEYKTKVLETDLIMEYCSQLGIFIKTASDADIVFDIGGVLANTKSKQSNSSVTKVKFPNAEDSFTEFNYQRNMNNFVKTLKFSQFCSQLSADMIDTIENGNWPELLDKLSKTSIVNTLLGVLSYKNKEYFLSVFHKETNSLLVLLEVSTAFSHMRNNIYKETTRKLVNKISHEVKNPAVVISDLSNELVYHKCDSKKVGLSIFLNSLCIIYNLKYFEYLYFLGEVPKMNAYKADLRTELEEIIFVFTELAEGNLKSINFVCDVEERDEFFVKVDYDKIKMILFILLNNSLKFTNFGEIKLVIEVVKEIKTALSIDMIVKFSVSDAGGGVSEQIKPMLFLPNTFETRNNNSYGCGNGLHIAKKLCEQLKSDLVYIDKSPVGSTFVFEILSSIEKVDDETVYESFLPYVAKNEITKETVKFDGVTIAKKDIGFNFGSRKTVEINSRRQKIEKESIVREAKSVYQLQKGQSMNSKMKSNFVGRERGSYLISDLKLKQTIELPKVAQAKLQHNSSSENVIEFANVVSAAESERTDFLDIKVHKIGNGFEEVNVVFADDDGRIRKQMVKLFEALMKNKSQKCTLNLYECNDGVETVAILFYFYKIGKRVDFIITDETMCFINGSFSISIIQNLVSFKIIEAPNIYFCTAYNSTEEIEVLSNFEQVKGVFSKPLKLSDLTEMFKDFIR